MAMAKGRGVRAVCGAVMAVVSVALGISGVGADDLVGSERFRASDAGDANSMASGGRVLWSRQPGTSAADTANGVATDRNGNVYVVGGTNGALGGANQGGGDPWVIKFDGGGRRLWSRQPGTSANDTALGVATDRYGNVYVVGATGGGFGGIGGHKWVIKFDGAGHPLWKRQPGTSDFDAVLGVATDQHGNVYVVGYTSLGPGHSDAFVLKLDGDGRLQWRRQPGMSDAQGVATDKDGNVYVVGGTCIRCDTDAWLTKYDGAGRVLWSRQPGTSDFDRAYGVATTQDGNVYVVGETGGALGGPNKGGGDAWVIKFGGGGRVLWSRQPGTSDYDFAYRVATDKDTDVSVVGYTRGSLGGPNKGDADAWVIKFDGAGRLLWSRQPGTSANDDASGVATDRDGNVYVVGNTSGALGGANQGGSDAWVIKYAR